MALETTFTKTARRTVSGGRGVRDACPAARGKPVILCVDDDPDALTILRLFLCGHGFEVTVASNGAEALRFVAEHRPDLVITDYAMPEMSGLELCRELRARRESCTIPIILHSGIEVGEDHPDLFNRVLLKPTDLELIAREIRSLLPAAFAQKSA